MQFAARLEERNLAEGGLKWRTWPESNRRPLPYHRPNIKYFNKLQDYGGALSPCRQIPPRKPAYCKTYRVCNTLTVSLRRLSRSLFGDIAEDDSGYRKSTWWHPGKSIIPCGPRRIPPMGTMQRPKARVAVMSAAIAIPASLTAEKIASTLRCMTCSAPAFSTPRPVL